MRQVELNAVVSYDAILTHFDKHPDAWQGIEPIEESIAYIRPLVGQMKGAARGQQERDLPAHTKAKNAALESMLETAYKMVKRLKVFARRTRNEVLLHAVDFSETELHDGPEKTVLDRCAILAKHAEGAQASPDAAACKITLASVAELNSAIEKVRPLTGQRDALGGERVELTASIPELKKKITAKLRELDDEVEGLVEDSAFIGAYFADRRINDRRGGKDSEGPKEG